MAQSKTKLAPPPIFEDIVSNQKATRAFVRYLLDLQRNTELESGDISNLETRVTQNELDILQNAANIAANAVRITQNEADILQNAADILSNASAITLLDGRVTVNEGDITALDGRVTVNEGAITALDGRVTTNEGDISTLQDERTRWRNKWIDGTYLKNDMARAGNFLFIANTTTTENPEPAPTGIKTYLLPDVPTWTPLSVVDTVYSGVRVVVTTGLFLISSIRLWIPNITADAHYRLVILDNVSGKQHIGSAFNGDSMSAVGWLTSIEEYAIYAGGDYSFLLASSNSASDTTYNHPYVYTGSTNTNNDPLAGNANDSNNNTTIRISATDRDSVDRHAELIAVVPSSTITYTSEANLNRFLDYEVISMTDHTTWVEYDVILLDTGSAGTPNDDEDIQAHFAIPVASATDYVRLDNHFASSAQLSGEIQIGNGARATDDNAYSVDLQLQQYTVSSEWDLASIG